MSPDVSQAQAARALLAFWRAAGVDMEEAEAVYAAAPVRADPASSPKPPRPVRAKAGQAGESVIETARALAESAASIAELRAAVEAFEGCGLKTTARTTVFADGTEDASVLLLGEAPGKEEDEQGKPFVGRPGQLLDRMLAAIGLDRKRNLLISNTIFWRPPGDRPPTQGEIAACLPFAERLIALAKPRIVILAGGAAAQSMLKRDETVGKMRGRRLQYNREGMELPPVNAMVMLHPAYLLRRPQEKRQAWGDLLLLEAWLDELGVARMPRA
jgi:uracil-DNA glycosylase